MTRNQTISRIAASAVVACSAMGAVMAQDTGAAGSPSGDNQTMGRTSTAASNQQPDRDNWGWLGLLGLAGLAGLRRSAPRETVQRDPAYGGGTAAR